VINGRPPFAAPPGYSGITRSNRIIVPSTTSAVVSYLPNGSQCTIKVWNNDAYYHDGATNLLVVDTNDSAATISGGRKSLTLSGLTSGGVTYYGKRWCGNDTDVFPSFRTQ
jgi:hypothetical protein